MLPKAKQSSNTCQVQLPGAPDLPEIPSRAAPRRSARLRSSWSEKRHQIEISEESELQLRDELSRIILNIRQSASSCSPRFWQFACKCGFRVIKSGCMRYDCEECAPQVKIRRAIRARERLDHDRQGGAILYTVLTVPPEFRSRYVDRKSWRKELRTFWRILRDEFAGEFALECSHPYGSPDEDDYSPDFFHPHANFLWRQRRGADPFLDVGTLIVLWTAQLNGLDRARSLEIWQEIRAEHPSEELAVQLQLARDALDVRTMSVAWHHYFKAPGEITKRIEYVCRTFPGFSSWTGSMRWYGKFPRRLPDRIWICERCGEPMLFIGASDADEYQAYLERSQQETRGSPDEDVPDHSKFFR